MYLQMENVGGRRDTLETSSTFLMMQVEIGGAITTQASIFSVHSSKPRGKDQRFKTESDA